MNLSSSYSYFILKEALYRDQVGRVWKPVILVFIGSEQSLTCLQEFFSIDKRRSTICCFTLT